MKKIILLIILALSLLAFTNVVFAQYYGYGYGYYGGPYWGPVSYRNFGWGGAYVMHAPAFTGSVLHPATFYGLATSRITTIPAFPAWYGFRSGFWW